LIDNLTYQLQSQPDLPRSDFVLCFYHEQKLESLRHLPAMPLLTGRQHSQRHQLRILRALSMVKTVDLIDESTKIVILGGGFGGLASRALYKAPDVTVVDRHNYQTFPAPVVSGINCRISSRSCGISN
jgi:hypothetical protein